MERACEYVEYGRNCCQLHRGERVFYEVLYTDDKKNIIDNKVSGHIFEMYYIGRRGADSLGFDGMTNYVPCFGNNFPHEEEMDFLYPGNETEYGVTWCRCFDIEEKKKTFWAGYVVWGDDVLKIREVLEAVFVERRNKV